MSETHRRERATEAIDSQQPTAAAGCTQRAVVSRNIHEEVTHG